MKYQIRTEEKQTRRCLYEIEADSEDEARKMIENEEYDEINIIDAYVTNSNNLTIEDIELIEDGD